MIPVHLNDGFSWICPSCELSWPGPRRAAGVTRFACPHCGDWCQAEVWPGTSYELQVEWRPPVCSVPWNACPGCSRPWEYFEGERRCFTCDIAHVGGAGDGCADEPTTVLVIRGTGGRLEGATRVFCACHTAVARRAMPAAEALVDLSLYVLPEPARATT